METSVVTTLITAGAMLLATALGFAIKAITGESRASVRKTMTEAVTNDAGASNSYMAAARQAAEMMTGLQNQINVLITRVDALETEREELQREITILRTENKQLREMIARQGGTGE